MLQVATVLLPQLNQMLEDAEAHPGVVTGQLQGDPTYDAIYTALQGRPSVVLLVSDGLMLVGKESLVSGMEESFRRSLIRCGAIIRNGVLTSLHCPFKFPKECSSDSMDHGFFAAAGPTLCHLSLRW